MSNDFITKDEGLFLLNYVDNALDDIEIELKLMQRYIDTAILSTCYDADKEALGLLFKASMDRIDSISNYALYSENRFLPPNQDYGYLNNLFNPNTVFVDPKTNDYASLFKLSWNINQYSNIDIPFKTPDNSGINYINCNFTGTSAFSSNDTAAYDGTKKYFDNSADNYVTLFFPSLTVDAMFSSYMTDGSSALGLQSMIMTPDYSSGYNPFTTSGLAYTINDPDNSLSKIYLWKTLLENNPNGQAIDFVNSVYMGTDDALPFTGDVSFINTAGFERIEQYRNYISILRSKLSAVNLISNVNTSLNDVLNQVNNSVASDIRISQRLDYTINITDYIPNFIKVNYPDATEFMQLFEDYLNTMYNGEGSYILDVSGEATSADAYHSVSYDKDGNVIQYNPLSIPEDQRISILEKIKRLAELSDPELIDFEYLSHFANVMGYKQSGFQSNFNDAFNSLALGYTLDDDNLKDISVDARKYLRFFISNLPSYYKIKGTNNCIKVLLYSFGLIGEIQTVFSSDYYNDWITANSSWDANNEVIVEDIVSVKNKGKYGVPLPTPHFKIRLDLTKSVASVGFDTKTCNAMLRAIEAVRPVNTVFDGINGLFYTNTPIDISIEPPQSYTFASSTTATISTDVITTHIDTFKYLPLSVSSTEYRYQNSNISDMWSNGYTNETIKTLNNLPDNGNCLVLKTLYTTAVDTRNYIVQRSLFRDNYIVSSSELTSSTLLVCPNDYANSDTEVAYGEQQLIANFTQLQTSAIGADLTGFIGFSNFIESAAATSSIVKFCIAIRKASTNNIEVYIPATTFSAESVLSSSVDLGLDGTISLKVVRSVRDAQYTPMTFEFFYRTRNIITGVDSGYISGGSLTARYSGSPTYPYPKYYNSTSMAYYPILNCSNNDTACLTALSFLSTT